MNDWLDKPWVIRIISLVLAILIFIVISFDTQKNQADDVGFDALDSFFSSSQETRTIEDMLVDINIDDDKYVVSGVPQRVSVTLEGSVNVVTSTATQRNFDVFVDLENLESGTHTVPLQYSGISDRVNVYIEPEEIEVIIEEKATEDFDVTVDYINEHLLEPEFELGEATIDPSTVTVSSARSVVDRIAIVKAFVDLEDVDGPIEQQDIPVKIYDRQGNELSVRVEPATVNVSINVSSPSKSVPIDVKTTEDLQEGITVNSLTSQPSEATIFAAEDVLNDIESISTEVIDLTDVEDGTTMDVELIVPSNIRKVEPLQSTVQIELTRTEERTMNLPIEVENLENENTISYVEPTNGEMNIIMQGTSDVISNLTEDDFRLFINVQDLQEGEHQVPIEMEGPEDIDIEPEYEQITVIIE